MRPVLALALLLALAACKDEPKPPPATAVAPAAPAAQGKIAAAPAPAPAAQAPGVRIPATDSRMMSEVGKRDANGTLVTTGKDGFLVYGPYMKWPAGKFRLSVAGTLTEAGADPGWIDIASGQGKRPHLKLPLPKASSAGASGVLASGEFVVEKPVDDMEVRIWVPRATRMAVSYYEISPLP